ncbi:hypothetical protein BOTBODRAFT_152046 [Botryobasidium botryosum FD-172 SS1]|uniref:Nuclear segregation protein Bfr1 n=1 Tax=Botryobasidium botryosum (strain FD-172 SS1) TaxID=930990 RepID=A0A067NA78_BOTB1|nr:hypothetical protein BOTBODRAFT_152046 [Botryobasidium botryosum FD-172 SS1]
MAANKSQKTSGGPANAQTKKPVEAQTSAETGQSHGRPDQAAYNAEQEKIKSEIDALQAKLNAVKDKIGLASNNKSGPEAERRAALHAELDGIRGQQAEHKAKRTKILDEVKAIQATVQKKAQELQTAKQKAPFKTVADLDARIKQLEGQVESGSLKLVDEKRALTDISTYKRFRRSVETFQADQEAIDADRARADELRKELDDPESKAISERFDAIRAELDEIKKAGDEAFANRNKLFDERTELQGQLDTLYGQKRESAQQFREANDRYWQKVNEDRARKAERYRAQRDAAEQEKRQEIADRLLEEAQIPAFQTQIEDCQTLIDYFSGKTSGITTPSATLFPRAGLTGVPKLELRKVEQELGEGVIVRKKKGEEDDTYFVSSKGKGKKSKPPSGISTPSSPSLGSSSQLNIPLPTLSALMQHAIPPPTSSADVPRTIENLKTKKAWYEANQAHVTAENIAKAEAEIKRLDKGRGHATNGHGNGRQEVDDASAPGADGDADEAEGNAEVTA